MNGRVELCVIGAGSAGLAAAEEAHAAGRSVIVISRPGDFGGTCIRRGCMPAKTLFTTTEALDQVERAPEVGVDLERVHVDLRAALERKNELVRYFLRSCKDEYTWLETRNGIARFISPDTLDVEGERISAERFVIATGATLVPPPIPGLAEAGYITSADALDAGTVPRRLAILGAGPVGCEFAQHFARLGAEVVLVQNEPQILRKEDADLADVVRRRLEADGVRVLTGTAVERIERTASGARLMLAPPGSAYDADRIMAASERRPDISALQLDRAGIPVDGGRFAVDPYLRTANPRVYAAGDVIGRRNLVHAARWAGALAVRNAFAEHPSVADFESVEAHAVFTQPQIAVAGLTEAEAERRGIALRVTRHPFEEVGKAVVSQEPEGFIKLLTFPSTGEIAGVGIVGAHAVDLIAEAVVLIAHRTSVRELASLPHLHPTMGEIYVRVAEAAT